MTTSYFAQVENGIVTQVISADQSVVDARDGVWIRTWYQAGGDPAKRYNYAGTGYSYDADKDAFIPPKPYPSWVLNPTTCLWDAPTPYPDDGRVYEWSEQSLSWQVVNLS